MLQGHCKSCSIQFDSDNGYHQMFGLCADCFYEEVIEAEKEADCFMDQD